MRRLFPLLLLAACAPDVMAPTRSERPFFAVTGDPVAGESVFVASCAECHATRDAFDLAYFSYTDTNIVRRALGHVNQQSADDIVAYVRSLVTPHVPETFVPWQPGGSVLASDAAFAVATFGQDGIPAGLTRTQLLALDPLQVRIAQKLLEWSTEVILNQLNSTLEWMPAGPLEPSVLAYNGNRVSTRLDAYYAVSSLANLHEAIDAIADAGFDPAHKVCDQNSSQKNFQKCFTLRVWGSSLAAQHMLRNGITTFLDDSVHQLWWDVGRIAQLSRGYAGEVPHRLQNTARWMYLGWMFDPVHIAAIYTVGALKDVQLPRHAAWVALRSEVVRLPGVFTEDISPYVDFRVMTGVVPTGTAWAYNAGNFALNELLRRLNGGDRPPTSALRTTATGQVNSGMTALQAKVTAAEYSTLNGLATQVRAGLQ
jgi:hypothetical protein